MLELQIWYIASAKANSPMLLEETPEVQTPFVNSLLLHHLPKGTRTDMIIFAFATRSRYNLGRCCRQ